MKKNFIISAIILLAAGITAFAQPQGQKNKKQMPSPEQRMEAIASHMAEKLLLSDDQSAQFIPVYKEYTAELQAINMQHKKHKMHDGSRRTDSQIDADIRDNFKKSQEILDLRVAYYDKFVKILNPRLVNEMYKIEKEQAQKAEFSRYARMHRPVGKDGAKPFEQKK